MHARRLETIPLNPLRFLENSLLDLIGDSLIGWSLIDNRWMLKQPDRKQTLQTSLNTRNLNYLRGPGNNMSSQTLRAVIIGSVLDFNPASSTLSTTFADNVLAEISEHGYTITRILETHAHVDHLIASRHL